MHEKIRITLAAAALGTLTAAGIATPALAGDYRMPMHQQQGDYNMMGGGFSDQGGMPGAGQGMRGGGMMGPGMMSGGMGMMGPMMGFDLNEEQLQEITRMHQQMAREHADMMAGMPALRYQLSRELSRDAPDAERVGELFLQMHQQRRQLMREQTANQQQMMQVLTEEQRDRMQEMMGDRDRMPRGGGDRPMHNR